MAKVITTAIFSICWLKAGLAYDSVLWTFSVCVWILFIKQLVFSKKVIIPGKIILALVFPYLVIFIASVFNNSHKKLSENDWNQLKVEDYLSKESNIIRGKKIVGELQNIRELSSNNTELAISLFYNLKRSHFVQNGLDPVYELLAKYENLLEQNHNNYIPCSVLGFKHYKAHHFKFFTIFAIAFVIYNSVQSRRNIELLLKLIILNVSLLAIVGIIQNINYSPSDTKLEILGIWNAPEPRYFYSTFTYKNHWASLALMAFILGLGLLMRTYLKNPTNFIRNKQVPLLFLITIPIVLSIPHSGSRSGFLLMMFFLGLLIMTSLFLFRKRFKISFPIISFAAAFGFLTIFGFSINQNTTSEMTANTFSQIEEIADGEYPMRILLWKDLLHQIQLKTFWGFGNHSYPTINPKYQSEEVRSKREVVLENAHNPFIPLVAFAHNDWLQLISEEGFAGFCLIGLPSLLVVISQLLFSKQFLTKICMLSCLSFLVYCFFDFPTQTPACTLIFGLILGLGLKNSQLNDAKPKFNEN